MRCIIEHQMRSIKRTLFCCQIHSKFSDFFTKFFAVESVKFSKFLLDDLRAANEVLQFHNYRQGSKIMDFHNSTNLDPISNYPIP